MSYSLYALSAMDCSMSNLLIDKSTKTNIISLYAKYVSFQVNTMTRTATNRANLMLSMPNVILRLEGLAVFIAAIIIYAQQQGSGLAFIILLFSVDLSAVGYLVNTRVGSIVYNTAHTYALPILLAVISLLTASPVSLQLALIWFAHIGMDRLMGFGLKYPTIFNDTHFQHV